jgi:predicted transcriptional regulator
MLRRNNSAIKKDIMGSLIFNGPLKLTKISCVTNSNYKKVKKLVGKLKEKGFVVEKNPKKDDLLYFITSTGLDFFRESTNQK